MSDNISDPTNIPTISEESTSLGNVRINNTVVANIVRIAALEVPGVAAVASTGFVDGIREIFRGKESDQSVQVSENEGGEYVIECRIIMDFGVELAKVAIQVQDNIADHIKRMTMKEVANVDVIIEDIRMPEDKKRAEKPEDYADATR